MYLLNLLPETLDTPTILAAVTLLVAVGVHYQKGLSYTEYREIMRVKRRVFPLLDTLAPFGFRSFVHEKDAPADDPEFVFQTNAGMKVIWRELVRSGGTPHLLSSNKRRPDGSLSLLHFVWMHEDGRQSEVYVFGDGSLYAHLETAVTDAEGHLSDGIEPGDVRGVLDDVSL